eukprot:jgi/Bigna1/89272/estExt_fgenesh1_pg.C_460086
MDPASGDLYGHERFLGDDVRFDLLDSVGFRDLARQTTCLDGTGGLGALMGASCAGLLRSSSLRAVATSSSNRINAKRVFFIRHGQAEHNVFFEAGRKEEGRKIRDPGLTPLGFDQASSIQEHKILNEIIKENESKNEKTLLIVSPLRRTLQTALTAFDGHLSLGNKGPLAFVCNADIQETGEINCDCGRPLSEVKEEFKKHDFIDFSYIQEDWHEKKDDYRDQGPLLTKRFNRFKKWMLERPEKDVIVVAHHNIFLANLGISFQNCEVREYLVKGDNKNNDDGGFDPIHPQISTHDDELSQDERWNSGAFLCQPDSVSCFMNGHHWLCGIARTSEVIPMVPLAECTGLFVARLVVLFLNFRSVKSLVSKIFVCFLLIASVFNLVPIGVDSVAVTATSPSSCRSPRTITFNDPFLHGTQDHKERRKEAHLIDRLGVEIQSWRLRPKAMFREANLWWALMVKNWHVKRRNFITTFFEIAIPVLVMACIIAVRGAIERTPRDPTHYYGNFNNGSMIPTSDSVQNNVLSLNANFTNPYLSPLIDPDNIVDVIDMEQMATKIIRRGHIIANTNLPDATVVTEEVRPSGGEYLRGFDSLSDMDSYAREDSYPEDGFLEAGIGFSSSADVRSGLTYTIRMNQTGGFTDGFRAQIPQTVFDEKRDDLSVEFNQEFVSRMYSSKMIVKFIPFPTPEHTEDDFADIMSDILPLLFALGFIWPVTRMIKAFVEEKELRIKEVYSLLIVLISRSVFEFSAPGIVFFFFFLYGEVIIAFCWLVSTIFSKASVGSTLGALVFLGAFFGFFGIPQNTASNSTKLAACLSAPICFGFGAQTLIEFESVSIGVTAENFDTPTSEFSMADAYTMLIVDFILYMILALYFERVVPQQWGSHLPPWFVFLPSWWCPARKPVDAKRREFGEFYEVPGGNEEIGVAIENLYKRFDNQAEEEAAVKYVNLDMFTNQIFALLGHNGAGKTTLINMLTGMILPTKGDALIFGQSISTDMRDIRADLGMCPQHNILWDYLTVKEHLYVYGRLKGVESCEDAASELIQNIGLTEKTNVISKNLSGGMKRKLNVAMALIGGPRVVFLDEPTSGMDPFSRRSTWDMLKRAKERRVLILTTHFMDEISLAIESELCIKSKMAFLKPGEIVACGTSLFLKNRYGVGYSLTITKKEGADSKRIKELVNKSIPKSEILSNVAGEISFQLPKASSRNFADLFDEIDKNLETLGVDAYSISVTTLEEVFLRVGEGVNRTKHIEAKVSSEEASLEKKQDHKAIIDAKVIEVSKEEVPMGRMFTALIMKRWLSSKRNINIWLWQLVYPTLIIIAGIGLLRLGLDNFRRDISLSTDQYNSPLRVPVGSSSFAPLISVDSSNLPLLNVTTPEGDSLTQTENCQFNPSNLVDSIVDILCTWTSFKETRVKILNWLGVFIPGHKISSNIVRTIFHNTTGTYASVIYLNILNTATYRSTVEDNSVSMDATLSAWPRKIIHYSKTAEGTREQEQLSTTFIALIAAIGYAFMPASVARQIVQEREINSKHLQLLSGVPLSIYWATAFTWDVLNMLPSALLSVAWFSAYDIEDLTGEAEFLSTGAVLLVLSIVLDIIPSTQDVNDDLKFIYRFFPSYCLGEVIFIIN